MSGLRPVAAAASGAGASLLPPLPFTGEGWGEGSAFEAAPSPGALCAPPSPAGGRGAFCSSASLASAASAASCVSITATTPPSDSVSPTLTLSSFPTPATDEGTSILALSDYRLTRHWYLSTV